MKDNPWIVGGDEVLKRFVISRLARPDDKQANSAREWKLDRSGIKVKVYEDKEEADRVCKNLNKY